MQITLSFLFMFVTIIIPGFIFQRIYYFGDFSKQFTTRTNIPQLLVNSLIPGILLLPPFIWFNNLWLATISIDDFVILFESISKSDQVFIKNSSSSNSHLNTSFFILKCAYYLVFSAGISFLLSRIIVRGLKLDRKTKMFRYRNQWYYVFSGEVFEFEKIKSTTEKLSKSNEDTSKILLTRADILIKGSEGNELYSGYVADYDLNPMDISKLDNIYLLDALRYKEIELVDGLPNLKQPKIIEKTKIPGELFVLNMSNVINVNVSYLKEKSDGDNSATQKNILLEVIQRIKNEYIATIVLGVLSLIAYYFSFYVILWNSSYGVWLNLDGINWGLRILMIPLLPLLIQNIFLMIFEKKIIVDVKRHWLVFTILLIYTITVFLLT